MEVFLPILSFAVGLAVTGSAQRYEVFWFYVLFHIINVMDAATIRTANRASVAVALSYFLAKINGKPWRVWLERYSSSPIGCFFTSSHRCSARLGTASIVSPMVNGKRLLAVLASSFNQTLLLPKFAGAFLRAKTFGGSLGRNGHGSVAEFAIPHTYFCGNAKLLWKNTSFRFAMTLCRAVFRNTDPGLFDRKRLATISAGFHHVAALPVQCVFSNLTGYSARARTEFGGLFSRSSYLKILATVLAGKRDHSSLPSRCSFTRGIGTLARTILLAFSPRRDGEIGLANGACFLRCFHAPIISLPLHSI